MLDWLSRFLGRKEQSRPTPTFSQGQSRAVLAPKVLVITYNPQMLPGAGLIQAKGWSSVQALIQTYIADIEECSGGMIRYEVVDSQVVEDFPVKHDGFRYSAKSYNDVINRRAAPHHPDTVDYHRINDQFLILDRVASGELDEIWLFGFPYAGFYESRMAGQGAFWCNEQPLENTGGCPRRFVIMGFSYERGVGEMLENFGHRTESVLARVYQGKPDADNLWKRYTQYDLIAPGRAEVGNVHFAPNSEQDYDWGNRKYVSSGCDDWLQYPKLTGERRMVNCSEWGNGDIRLHHKWWLSHLPKAEGSTDGILNNWWRYTVQVDDPFFAEQQLGGLI